MKPFFLAGTLPSEFIVELDQITRTFEGERPVFALRGIDLKVKPGESLAIRGASGSGKSTLLNILGLLDRPTSGSYLLSGQDVSILSDNDRTALRGQQLGFVFQSFQLLKHRTVLENVMMSDVYGTTETIAWTVQKRKEEAFRALERVRLDDRIAAQKPTKLSGGECQRVAIARAILRRPPLLLCDEPTGNLDSDTTDEILLLFRDLLDDGLTILMITHDNYVAGHMDREVRIRDGKLLPEEAKHNNLPALGS